MLYYLASYLTEFFGPARLLQSFTVLISLALYTGFLVTSLILPKTYRYLPSDRGREFLHNAEAAKGKPTGAGSVFITIFVFLAFLFVPLDMLQIITIVLVWFTMLTGYLDDKSTTSWSEYRKAALDLALSIFASVALFYMGAGDGSGNGVQFWLPFIANPINIHPLIYIGISTVFLWTSINTTNCTDGVDGLSSILSLLALITMGSVFYFILGNTQIASYLLVPHLVDGASWAVITFCFAGVLMGYLWHNANPSKVLMGDAGSRAVGFFIGVAVMVTGNPFFLFATSSVMLINGGTGLLKVFLLRFFKIKIFSNIRFPLHDHFGKNENWSVSQVLIKFLILQMLVTIAVLGVILKVR